MSKKKTTIAISEYTREAIRNLQRDINAWCKSDYTTDMIVLAGMTFITEMMEYDESTEWHFLDIQKHLDLADGFTNEDD